MTADDEFRHQTAVLVSQCLAGQAVLEAALCALFSSPSLDSQTRATIAHNLEQAYAIAQATSLNSQYFETFESTRENLMTALAAGENATATESEPAASSSPEASAPPA